MVEEFRFVLSAEFAPYADSGAAVGATGLYSTTGALVDVYPMIVTGQEAWGNVMLRGADAIKETWVAPNTPSGGDPMGLRGYAGAKFYYDALILNQGFMAVVESARNALN